MKYFIPKSTFDFEPKGAMPVRSNSARAGLSTLINERTPVFWSERTVRRAAAQAAEVFAYVEGYNQIALLANMLQHTDANTLAHNYLVDANVFIYYNNLIRDMRPEVETIPFLLRTRRIFRNVYVYPIGDQDTYISAEAVRALAPFFANQNVKRKAYSHAYIQQTLAAAASAFVQPATTQDAIYGHAVSGTTRTQPYHIADAEITLYHDDDSEPDESDEDEYYDEDIDDDEPDGNYTSNNGTF